MSKHILLVAYIFPPSPGIGGRRWAKFAKYFTRKGYIVHVICSEQKDVEQSLWINDVKDNPKIILYPIKQKYPAILRVEPKSIIEKIKYKIAYNYMLMLADGSVFDRSFFWKQDFETLAKKIISENKIDYAIVTIAPLSYAVSLINLKKHFPNTKFIADFRDPWSNGKGYGFPQKDKRRQQAEFEKEKLVCQNFDLITFAHQNTLNESLHSFAINAKKCYLLEHSVDADDYTHAQTQQETNFTNILYIGTLYEGLKKYFDVIFSSLASQPNLKFQFYTSNQKDSYFEYANRNQIKLSNQIAPRQLFQEISKANYVLIIYSEHMKTLMYTKIKEIVFARTPIIIISNRGEASDFIVNNKLGVHISFENIATELPIILSSGTMKDYNANFDTSDFLFEHVTNKFLNVLQKI